MQPSSNQQEVSSAILRPPPNHRHRDYLVKNLPRVFLEANPSSQPQEVCSEHLPNLPQEGYSVAKPSKAQGALSLEARPNNPLRVSLETNNSKIREVVYLEARLNNQVEEDSLANPPRIQMATAVSFRIPSEGRMCRQWVEVSRVG
jgi:hypothetical protein